MIIDPKKLLPPPRLKSSTAIVKRSKFLPTTYNEPSALVPTKEDKDNLEVIEVKIDDITNLITDNNLLRRRQLDTQRENTEDTKREEKEKEKEKRTLLKIPKIFDINLPKMGILDTINRFILFTFLGWLFNNIYPHLPKILEFIKFLTPVGKFLESFVGNFFETLTNFVYVGYKAYDKVKEFTKSIGGENFQKTFDDFSDNLNKFVNLAIIAGLLSISGGEGKGKPTTTQTPRTTTRPRVTTSGGRAAGRPDIRNPLRQRPQVTQGGQLRQGVTRPRITVSGGQVLDVPPKSILRSIRPFLKRIPLAAVGALIDFGLSLALGEPPGRAAFKAIGAGLAGAIGAAIGSLPVLLPFGGPFIGGMIGGVAGDALGATLYDMFFEGKTPQKPTPPNKPVKKQAVGGKVGVTTRKGKVVGGKIKRTVKKFISPKKPSQVQPGKDIGGPKVIEKMYPKSEDTKTINPFKFITDTTNYVSRQIDYVGSMFSLFGKMLLGQFPNKADFDLIGSNINAWISNAMLKGNLKGNLSAGMADGGVVETQMMGDISKWASRSIEELVKGKVTKAINDLRRSLGLDPLTKPADTKQGELGEGMGLLVTSDSPDFWLLATAALFENSDPQGAADVAQAIYNRVAMPGDPWKTNNSIRTAILNPGQFQPVTDYGGASVWNKIKTKEDAIKFARTYGRSQTQLETIAAAILDKQKQQSARQFVGPRDSFRSYAFEDANNHLANETEVRRLGHAFGFEPRGATIGLFKAGKLTAAQVTDQVSGSVSATSVSLASAAESSKGMDTSSGPDGGGNACVWAVNKVFQRAGMTPPWGNALRVSVAESAMIRSGYSKIAENGRQPGDIYIARDKHPSEPQIHIGIVTRNGNIISNSSSSGKFSWEAPPSSYEQRYGAKGSFYRMPSRKPNSFRLGGPINDQKIKPIQSYPSYNGPSSTIVFIPIVTERMVPVPMSQKQSINFQSTSSVNRNTRMSKLSWV